MRLNRGERPEPLPSSIQKTIREQWDQSTIQQYPSYQKFYEQLACHVGCPQDQLVVGAGIEEFIRTLMFLACDPGQRAAVLWPTCAMYEIYAKAFSVNLQRITPSVGRHFSFHELLSGLAYDIRILFLPNPGQPVETYFDLEALELIAQWCYDRRIILAVDEAHCGFGAATALPLVSRFENVLVLRTFSKFYGAASIRVGYAVGQPNLVKPLHAVRPSGEITGFSIAAASALITCYSQLEDDARETAAARDWLRDELNKMPGLQAYGRYGFSMLIEFPGPHWAKAVAAALARRGVYVKSGFPPPVESCLLVACGAMKLVQEFYKEFYLAYAGVFTGVVHADPLERVLAL
jgi:histidinol-phosphate/aromatic aminotransferase/cobyric acid decarboxylase-like protein